MQTAMNTVSNNDSLRSISSVGGVSSPANPVGSNGSPHAAFLMDSWEFLLQKKGTRSWLPLKRRRLKIEAGIYRIIAQSCRANVEVEIRVIHRTIDEIPPKRRSQKRTCRTSKEGLMVAIPFTYIRPGFWEFRCVCEKMNEIQGEPWQEIVQLEVIPAKVPQETKQKSSPSVQTKISVEPSEIPVREVKSPVASPPSPVEKEPIQTHLEERVEQEQEEAIAAKSQPQVLADRQTAIATHLEKQEEAIASQPKSQPIVDRQPTQDLEEREETPIPDNFPSQPKTVDSVASRQLITNNITNNTHSLLEQSIQNLEDILEQVSEPETQPQKSSKPERQNIQTEKDFSSLPSLPAATKTDLEDINLPKDLSISLLQDHFIRRKDEPLLISGHVNSFDLTQTSILDSGFEGILHYELRDPHGTELLLDVCQPLSDATIPLVFNYLLDIPTEYDTSLILGEVILEIFLDRGDGRAKKAMRLASQTFSITAGLDDLLNAIAHPIESEPGDRVKQLHSGFSQEEEKTTLTVNIDFLELTKRESESRPFQPTGQQVLPPKLSLPKVKQTANKKTGKTKNIDLPNFNSPPPRVSASHTYQVSSLANFLSSPTDEDRLEKQSSETDDNFSDSTITENNLAESNGDRVENNIENNINKTEDSHLQPEEKTAEITRDDVEVENNIADSNDEYIAESSETALEEEKEKPSLKKVQMEGRFWKQINLLKVDEEVNNELIQWLQENPVRSQLLNPKNPSENERQKNNLEATAQRLAEKAEILQELAEEEKIAALADLAEELELSDRTSEHEILEKLAREAAFLHKLAAEMDSGKEEIGSEQKSSDREDLKSKEIPSPIEEEVQLAEVTIDRINHEFVVDDDEEDEREEELSISGALPKHDTSGLPYPVGIQNLVAARSMSFPTSIEKNREEIAISEIPQNFLTQPNSSIITQKPSLVSPQLRPQIPIPTPILDIPDGELSGGDLVLIRVRLPAYPGAIYVKLWVQDRETRQLLDGPRAFVDFTGNKAGELETLTQLIVPLGSLSIRFEAIAIDVETQKESHKASCDRTVIPPEFQQKSYEII